jgi:hypothetical protein
MKRSLPLSLALLLALLLFVAGCDAADPTGSEPQPQTTGIVVAAQGAFGQDTGGVIRFNLDGTVAARYPGGGGGLYIQSADARGPRVFATTAASVDVLNATTLQRTARLDVPNPRYLAFNGDVAFVTSLFTNPTTFGDGAVTRLAVPAGGAASVGPRAVIGGNPEGIALAGGRLYVANTDFGRGSTVTVLNPTTLAEVERIEVCAAPRFLFADAQEELVVVCEGRGGDSPQNGAFVVLNGRTGQQVARVNLTHRLGSAGPGQTATYVPETQEVYAVDSAGRRVVRFDTRANALAGTLQVGGAPIGAVGYDVSRERLLLGRHAPENPFTQQGTLTLHTRNGDLVQTFQNAGIAPTHIAVITEAAN